MRLPLAIPHATIRLRRIESRRVSAHLIREASSLESVESVCPTGRKSHPAAAAGTACDPLRPARGVFDCVTQGRRGRQRRAPASCKKLGVAGRAKVIEIVKHLAVSQRRGWGKFEMEETKIGRLDHKIGKLLITKNVPGSRVAPALRA